MDKELGRRILQLKDTIVTEFDAENWTELGLLMGLTSDIDHHPRLLRSLDWGDGDYPGNVLSFLKGIAQKDKSAFEEVENFVESQFEGTATYVSAKPSAKRLTFAPNVFKVPDDKPQDDLVSVMMPFEKSFDPVHSSIRGAAESAGYRCQRVDDLWEDSVVVQDVFSLVFRSRVVVVDFTGKNANVFYETGIAHTLGKLVVPVSQSLDDVPFDLRHHRVLKYLPNAEGLAAFQDSLARRLSNLGA